MVVELHVGLLVRRALRVLLATVIFATALVAVALASQQQGGASVGAPLLGLADVERALRGRGLEVSPTGEVAYDPRLDVPGHVLQVNGSRVVVYLFPSTAARVSADQQLTIERVQGEDDVLRVLIAAPRFVTARNALLIYTTDDARLSTLIYHSAVDLARS
jgi:hypothetical protein